MKAELSKSNAKNKKYKVILIDADKKRTIHFGDSRYDDFTTHKDPKRKESYIARHGAQSNFDDPFTASYWSRWILWSKPTIEASVRDLRKRNKSLEIINKI